jgi:diguanylate cyclase with GGDEF domain/PucR-like helix-turn-helix protein
VAVARIFGVAPSSEILDPEYAEGLRATVGAALDYGFAGIECGRDQSPPLPTVALAQARLAARNGVSLDTVLRRYFAGYTLLGDFVMQEAEHGDQLPPAVLRRVQQTQAHLFDRLIAAVTDEYLRESKSHLASTEERRVERVKRLLKGEFLDTSDFAYDFDAHHLGILAAGSGATEAIRDVAGALNRRLFLVARGEGTVWAWLGSREPTDPDELSRLRSRSGPVQMALAVGEPAQGMDGWRLTHRQAKAAMPIALRSPESLVRYSDVALLSAILQDDLLATSLRELYLAPLAEERNGGAILRETLRCYFRAARNVSSAAAALGVSRQTVINRLRVVDACLHRPLATRASEMEAALQLDEFDTSSRREELARTFNP